jgi:hypothetical protein
MLVNALALEKIDECLLCLLVGGEPSGGDCDRLDGSNDLG